MPLAGLQRSTHLHPGGESPPRPSPRKAPSSSPPKRPDSSSLRAAERPATSDGSQGTPTRAPWRKPQQVRRTSPCLPSAPRTFHPLPQRPPQPSLVARVHAPANTASSTIAPRTPPWRHRRPSHHPNSQTRPNYSPWQGYPTSSWSTSYSSSPQSSPSPMVHAPGAAPTSYLPDYPDVSRANAVAGFPNAYPHAYPPHHQHYPQYSQYTSPVRVAVLPSQAATYPAQSGYRHPLPPPPFDPSATAAFGRR